MKSWKKVYSTDQIHKATIIRDVLEESALNPVMVNKRDTIYQIGQVEIYVAPEHVLRAIKIINDNND